jgi:Na+-transporting methylmalonyl-CoA/oxaloacetate decarboxylase gamma subunit
VARVLGIARYSGVIVILAVLFIVACLAYLFPTARVREEEKAKEAMDRVLAAAAQGLGEISSELESAPKPNPEKLSAALAAANQLAASDDALRHVQIAVYLQNTRLASTQSERISLDEWVLGEPGARKTLVPSANLVEADGRTVVRVPGTAAAVVGSLDATGLAHESAATARAILATCVVLLGSSLPILIGGLVPPDEETRQNG